VYSLEELRTLVSMAHARGLGVHVDGARLGCAVASLGTTLREMLVETGVDAVSFGGTKQGMLLGEAVVYLKPGLGQDFPYWQKHAMQLASKMRYVAAQFDALLEDDLWLENGRKANAMAQQLLAKVKPIPDVEVLYPVQANSVFARIPPATLAPLQEEMFFWPWDEKTGVVRWMCAFDTEPEDVARFAAAVARVVSTHR
jgi:threonine aldolase